MIAETILAELLRVNLVASAAILSTLLLRPWVLRSLGARVAYWLWLIVPITAAVNFMPARERIVFAPPPAVVVGQQEAADEVSSSPSAPIGASAADARD